MQTLALLFKNTEGFDKTQLGEYMGEGGPKAQFNIDVLHAFVDTYSFIGLTFDNALRALLKGFRLPGEVQNWERTQDTLFFKTHTHLGIPAFLRGWMAPGMLRVRVSSPRRLPSRSLIGRLRLHRALIHDLDKSVWWAKTFARPDDVLKWMRCVHAFSRPPPNVASRPSHSIESRLRNSFVFPIITHEW